MKRVVTFLVVYAVTLLVLIVVVVGISWTSGVGQPRHGRMDPVSHNDYELHRSIGRVP